MSSCPRNGPFSLCRFMIASSLLGAHALPSHCPIFRHLTLQDLTNHLFHPQTSFHGHCGPHHLSLAGFISHHTAPFCITENRFPLDVRKEPAPPQHTHTHTNMDTRTHTHAHGAPLPHCPLSFMSYILVFSTHIRLFSLQAEPCFHRHLAPYLNNQP